MSRIYFANARLKGEFGGKQIWVRSHTKVMSHLMFGLPGLTADQLLRCSCNWGKKHRDTCAGAATAVPEGSAVMGQNDDLSEQASETGLINRKSH